VAERIPNAAIDVMPGATSLPGSKRFTSLAMSAKMRRALRKEPCTASGALLMLPSSIQNAHSGAGTLISALGKNSALSLVLMPLMWSGWKCEMTMVSIDFGSMPAAARLAAKVPDCGAIDPNWPPVPVSSAISFDPVFTTSAVNGIGSLSVGRKASLSAFWTSAKAALRTNLSSNARYQVPSLMAVIS
jgi:hypothetical protein